MNLLEALKSPEADEILQACHAIRHEWDRELLRSLATVAGGLEPRVPQMSFGGALRLNRTYVESALERIRLAEAGLCLCRMYMKDSMYDPKQEARAGRVQILTLSANQEQRGDEIDCRCAECGTQYHVEERSYHYPWWKWTAR